MKFQYFETKSETPRKVLRDPNWRRVPTVGKPRSEGNTALCHKYVKKTVVEIK